MSLASKWKKLKVVPDKDYGIPIEYNNAIIVPLGDALLEYDTIRDKWKQIHKYPYIHASFAGPTEQPLLHCQNNILFIATKFELYDINLRENSWGQISYHSAEHSSTSLFVGNDFHLINCLKHSKFNMESKRSMTIDTSNIRYDLNYFHAGKRELNYSYLGSVYLKTEQLILLIDSKTIFSYNLITNEWSDFKVQFPRNYALNPKQFGYILTENDRDLILFSYQEIWIIDLENKEARLSKIRPPIPNQSRECYYHAVIGNAYIEGEILSNGYIRDCWSKDKDKMKNVRYPPLYLIKIIEKYFCYPDHEGHLFGAGHWKMKINDILSE